jgi:hypothetical protein
MDDADQFLRGLGRGFMIRRLHDPLPDVVFDHLGDETIQCAAARCCLLQHSRASGVVFQGAPYRVHLSADTVQPLQQFGFFSVQANPSLDLSWG